MPTCFMSHLLCPVAWQLARFKLTRRIARSVGDSWASCMCLLGSYGEQFTVQKKQIKLVFGCGCDFSKWLIVGKESDSKFVKVQQLHLPLTWIILVDVLVLNFLWISCGLKSAYFDRALFRTCRESSRTCTYVCSLCNWLAGTVRNLRIGYRYVSAYWIQVRITVLNRCSIKTSWCIVLACAQPCIRHLPTDSNHNASVRGQWDTAFIDL